MSLQRLVYYCAMIGGWAALLGWMIGELVLLRRAAQVGAWSVFLSAALVGMAIGGGLTLLGGLANGTWKGQLQRLWPGLAGGFLGGFLGSLAGNLVYEILPRALGWMFMGLAIGSAEGLYDRSWKKIRNGLLGGGLGGLLGGFLFDPVSGLIGSAMSSRAVAFVILGLCIGLFIGLAQVVLKEAWLTVEAGFRPGRQLILDRAVTALGTSEKAELPFIAFGARGLEPIHLRIHHRPDGSYVLEDNASRSGTFVNGQRLLQPALLHNDDLIQLGPNVVRFRERYRAPAPQTLPAARPVPAAPRASPVRAAPAAWPPAPSQPPPLPTLPLPAAAPAAALRPVSSPPPAPTPPAAALKPMSNPPPAPAPPPAGPKKSCPLCSTEGAWKPAHGKYFCGSCGIYF